MFCASLRKRPEWAKAGPLLQQKEPGKWREGMLKTHDLQISIPETGQRKSAVFRFILLSAIDVDAAEFRQRAERLYGLEGGSNCAMIFLLQADGKTQDEGIMSLAKLQIKMMDGFEMSVLPLTSLEELPTVITAFKTRYSGPQSSQTSKPDGASNSAQKLLQHCIVGLPLSETKTHILSDINSSFSDLVDKVSSIEGQLMLRDYLDGDADRIIQFWNGKDPKA